MARRQGGSRTGAVRSGGLGVSGDAHRRALADGWGQLTNNAGAALLSIAVMAIALGFPALLVALLGNQQAVVAEWGAEPTVSVFLHEGVTLETAESLAAAWGRRDDVVRSTVIERGTAFAEFTADLGFSGNAALTHNPLPHIVVLTPHTAGWPVAAAADKAPLLVALNDDAAVAAVIADVAWIRRLEALSALAGRGVAVLAALLTLAGTLMVSNSVRVLVHQQARAIRVQLLVGATAGYIRRPFLYGGAIHGAIAGILAIAMIYMVFWTISGPVESLARSYASGFELGAPGVGFAILLIFGSAAVGWAGALIGSAYSIRRLTRDQAL